MDASARLVEGMAAAAVTREEVRALILCAQSAWRAQRAVGLADEPFDAWRRAALWDAVRKTSFRALGQREYGLALAEFIRLGGGDPARARGPRAAVARRESCPEGDRRRASWKLERACEEAAEAFGGAAGARAYAHALLRQIHKTEPGAATARQLVQTMFTLRARAAKRLREAMREAAR